MTKASVSSDKNVPLQDTLGHFFYCLANLQGQGFFYFYTLQYILPDTKGLFTKINVYSVKKGQAKGYF